MIRQYKTLIYLINNTCVSQKRSIYSSTEVPFPWFWKLWILYRHSQKFTTTSYVIFVGLLHSFPCHCHWYNANHLWSMQNM